MKGKCLKNNICFFPFFYPQTQSKLPIGSVYFVLCPRGTRDAKLRTIFLKMVSISNRIEWILEQTEHKSESTKVGVPPPVVAPPESSHRNIFWKLSQRPIELKEFPKKKVEVRSLASRTFWGSPLPHKDFCEPKGNPKKCGAPTFAPPPFFSKILSIL